MRRANVGVAALAAALSLACTTGRKSPIGFRLPDGDPARGREVFVELRCQSCHTVAGVELPGPVAEPPVPVILGGQTPRLRTDGELVTAIVDPSHRLAPGYKTAAMTSGGLSRMGDFSEVMKVRELIDLVAFLQSRYEVVPPPQPIAY